MALPLGLSLREARKEDGPAIGRMVRRAGLDPTQLRWSQFLVVEQEPRIVAIGQLRQYGGVQELGSLVVEEAWRRHGIGAELVRALIARRRCPLYLECTIPLVPYYEKFGFRRVPVRAVPWPLKAKFLLSFLLGRLMRVGVASMYLQSEPDGTL